MDLLFIIGSGGTSCHLLNLLKTIDLSESRIVLLDGDKVSLKNTYRQLFELGDVGLYKVSANKEKFSQFFPIEEIPLYLKSSYEKGEEEDTSLFFDFIPYYESLKDDYDRIFIFGMTDRNSARRFIHQAFSNQYSDKVFLIDSGCGVNYGQAIVSSYGLLENNLIQKYPQMIEEEDEEEIVHECAAEIEYSDNIIDASSKDQSFFTNNLAALSAFTLFKRIYFSENIQQDFSNFIEFEI